MKFKNKQGNILLTQQQIQIRVKELGKKITEDYKDKNLHVVVVLNGAYAFASDLLKEIKLDLEVSFIKVSSYEGVQSTGKIKSIIGIDKDLNNKDVLIIEDIIETGLTMTHIINDIIKKGANQPKVCSLLVKPNAPESFYNYVGFLIGTQFVIGYGLDYDGLYRNLPDIWELEN